MPPMFVPAGVVAMSRHMGPKPAVVLTRRVELFRKENGGLCPDSLHLTITDGIPPVGIDETAEWETAFEAVREDSIRKAAAAAVGGDASAH